MERRWVGDRKLAEQYQVLCRRVRAQAKIEKHLQHSSWFETTHVWVEPVAPCGLLVRLLARAFGRVSSASLEETKVAILTHSISGYTSKRFTKGQRRFLVRANSVQSLGWWRGHAAPRRGHARKKAVWLAAQGAYGCLRFAPYGGKIVHATALVKKLCASTISKTIATDQKFHEPQTLQLTWYFFGWIASDF